MHFATLLPYYALSILQFSPTPLVSGMPASPALQSRDLADHGITPFPFSEADISQIESVFSTLESVPDDVLQGDDATLRAWISQHSQVPPPPASPPSRLAVREPDPPSSTDLTTRSNYPNDLETRDIALWIQIGKCAFEIGKAIAENVFPGLKLRRAIELIRSIGGARKVAKMLLKAKSLKELIAIGGPELVELAEIFLGITDVARACFSIF